MRGLVVSAALVGAVASGCSGGEHSKAPLDAQPAKATVTLRSIESSIAERCKAAVAGDPFPSDRGHRRFRAAAEDARLIRCRGQRHNLSAYARFKSRTQLREAVGSIVLPPGRVEQLCLTDRESFTTDFWGSVEPACKKAGGRIRNVRRPPIPSGVTGLTYAPNCGITYYLEIRPRQWSTGCTAGSVNMRGVVWDHWDAASADATGTAVLRGPCDPDCVTARVYRAPARVRLARPRQCNDQGARLRFFARARFEVLIRAGNPFGEPLGWRREIYNVKPRPCRLSLEDPLLHPVSG